MRTPPKKDFGLAVLVAALVAAAGLVPLAWHYGRDHAPASAPPAQVATGPAPNANPTQAAPAAPAAPAEPAATDTEAAPPAPAGTELVPPEESETDRGATSASPAGPTLSAGRAAGLHMQPDPMHLSASAAVVVDQDTGQTLVQKNDQAVLPMASLTKLMTTLLVLEAKQPMDEVLTITEEDVDKERHSRSRLRVGTSLTREEALRLALMSSENRAAHALGRNYPGGLPKLVEAMNARAHALGMQNTTYVDPTGLSNRNQSTAHDLSLLVGEAAKNPLMREFSTTPAHLASLSGRTLQYRNSNSLVRNQNSGWDIELQKTGYIVEAGRCLTMLTKVAGHNLIMVLLDADSNNARVADARRLRNVVVARNGWQDDIAVARAAEPRRQQVASKAREDGKAQKVSSTRHKAKKGGKTRTDVAAKHDSDTKPVAARKSDKRSQVAAHKDVAKKDGRVSRSFAAARASEKS